MAKKLKTLVLSIGNPHRWVNVILDNCDGVKGYFLGSVQMDVPEAPISFHVEAIEATEVKGSLHMLSPLRPTVTAVNKDYQNRLDNYFAKNDGSRPQLVKIGRKKYFIHIDPYAR